MIYKFSLGILALIFFTSLFFIFLSSFNKASAQITSCTSGSQAEGLISGQSVFGKFGNTNSVCILNPSSSYADYKVQNFDSLLFDFFSRVNASSSVQKLIFENADHTLKNITQADLNFTPSSSYLVSANDVTISSTISGSNTAIIFVNGNLNIQSNIIYGTGTTGLVFVVKGNTHITQTVSEIDAVIVGQGQICTAYDPLTGSCSPADVTPQLTVYGSLISLDQNTADANPIIFGRISQITGTPSETINEQAKYLVILKGLFTNNYTFQREIKLTQIPNIVPPPTAPPLPNPSPSSGTCLGNPLQIFTTCLINQLQI